MNKKHNVASTKIKNPLLLIIFLLIMTIMVVFLYNRFFKNTISEVYSIKQTYQQRTTLPTLTAFNTASLERRSFYRLKTHGILQYSKQIRAVATDQSAPIPPDQIEVMDGQSGGTLIIFWQKPQDAKYQFVKIYRSEQAGQLGNMVAENLAASGNYEDTDLKDNQKYYYTIKSVNIIDGEEKESSNTNYYEGIPTDKLPPATPKNLQIIDNGEGAQLKITWENPIDEDFAYINIYRSEKLGILDSNNQAISVKDSEEFVDMDVKNNVVYYYTVTAVDQNGNESSKNLLLSSGGNPNPFATPPTNSNING
jgi:hypothetical protein